MLKRKTRYSGVKKEAAIFAINHAFIMKIAESGLMIAIVSACQSGTLRDEDRIWAIQKLDLINPADSPDEVINSLHNCKVTLTGGTNDNSE